MIPVPDGFCACGCGERTKVRVRTTRSRGRVKGKPARYLSGHNFRKAGPRFLEEDRGYTSPCWIWQRKIDRDGYGVLRVARKMQLAHRYYYQQQHGRLGTQQLDHLEPVTHPENAHRGVGSKLTREAVLEIRRARLLGARLGDLARNHAVSVSAIAHVVHGRTWVSDGKEVPDGN